MTRPLILLVNDDGITSPGLAASAAALDPLGDLLIVAPSVQQSGMGRSFPASSDGRLFEATVSCNGQSWKGYSANASPAQSVQHALIELADRTPDLVVSGINYGENIGTGITASGTVGAAMEAAAFSIPALAVSLQVADTATHITCDPSVDFSAAIHFTRLFARAWLQAQRPPDVDLLKIDIPLNATPQTPWRMACLERAIYYVHVGPLRTRLDEPGRIGYIINPKAALTDRSDAMLLRAGFVAVTPLTLDITARVAEAALRQVLDGPQEKTHDSSV